MPSTPATLTVPSTAPNRRGRFAMRGLRSVGFGVAIGLLLTGAFGTPLWPNLVQSVCIATLCWFTIDLGRIPLALWKHRHDPPGSPESSGTELRDVSPHFICRVRRPLAR